MAKRKTPEQKAKAHINNVLGGLRKRGATKRQVAAARKLITDRLDPRLVAMCPWCQSEIHGGSFSLDHMTPVSAGGGHGTGNLALVCPSCNRVKGDMNDVEFGGLCSALSGLGRGLCLRVFKRLAMSGYAYGRGR